MYSRKLSCNASHLVLGYDVIPKTTEKPLQTVLYNYNN